MSETEDRTHRVTWRSIPSAAIGKAGNTGYEFLDVIDVTAAYYKREDGMVVFKKADGAITFTVAEHLVETIRVMDDATATA